MKQTAFFGLSLLLILSGLANAQSGPPPPTPVVESDLRDNTIRMRSVELDRIVRESKKLNSGDATKLRENRLAEIKEDFENIQKLQDWIIKEYTTERKINYSKMSKTSTEIWKRSVRLDANLFAGKSVHDGREKQVNSSNGLNLTDSIVELDNAIGRFVSSPLFKNTKLVDTSASQLTQMDLAKIILLSELIALQADNLR